MKLFQDKRYPYTFGYEASVCDLVRWTVVVILNIIIMCTIQFMILCVLKDNEMEMASRGMVLTQ